MLVVSDATPINILVRIGHIEVLPRLFQTVFIPSAVAGELSQSETPETVRIWLASKPTWLAIRTPTESSDQSLPKHRGEREAIQLARELSADLLLVDELRPRRLAIQLGIRVIGTIGVLERASSDGLLDLKSAFAALRRTDFYISHELLDLVLARHQKRGAENESTSPPPQADPDSHS